MAPRVGDFALERVIGSGGMGQVWSARHTTLGTPVALKVLRATDEERPRDALRHEIRAMARLDHPGVVWVYDYGEVTPAEAAHSDDQLQPNSPWIAMELASGGSLTQIPRLMGWRELQPFLLALLDALAHAHAHDLIHRDLKPANILICGPEDQRPGIKLTDFGISQALHEEDRDGGRVVGTPQYMAPEQIVGAFRRSGPWTDLYALGSVAWLLATGRRVFEAYSGQGLVRAQLSLQPGKFSPVVNVPAGFEDWLRTLLQKHPNDRFRCAADAAWALRQLPDAPEDESLPLGLPGLFQEPAEPVALELGDYGEEDFETEVEDVTEEVTERVLARHAPMVREIVGTWRRPGRASPRRLGTALFGLRQIPLVGREAERDALWDALAAVHRRGMMRSVHISGMTGVGKSRLCQWMAQRTREVGAADVLRVQFKPDRPADEALRLAFQRKFHVLGMRDDLAERLIHRTLRDLGSEEADLRVGTHQLLSSDSMMDTASRYAQMNMLLALFCRARPQVVWLDDVQYGMDGVRWLASLQAGQKRRPIPVLVMTTAQDEALAEHADVARELVVLEGKRLALGPLPSHHQSELAEKMLGLEPRLAVRVVERTQGNPMFAVQLVSEWVERGVLEQRDHGLHLTSNEGALPSSIGELMEARIEKVLVGLPQIAGELLEGAAVIGPEVNAIEWAAMCRHPRVRRKLEPRLVSARLAEETESGFVFLHATVVEALLERARRAGRLALHHAAAAEMLQRRPSRRKVAERLGHHLLGAGRPEEAVDPFLMALEVRRRRLGNRAALALIAQALKAAESLAESDGRRWRLHVEQAQSLVNLGEAEDAVAILDDVEPFLQADAELRALARIVRAQAARDQGDVATCEAASLEAASLIGESGDAGLLGQAWWMATLAAVDTGRDALVQERGTLSLRALRREGNDHGRAEAHRMMAYMHIERREYALGKEEAERALMYYRQEGSISGQARAQLALGHASLESGDSEAAWTAFTKARALFEAWSPGAAMKATIGLAFVCLARQQYARAYNSLSPIVRDADGRAERFLIGRAWIALVEACAGLGLWSEFDHALSEAETHIRSRSRVVQGDGTALRRAADLARRQGHTSRANRVRELSRSQR